MKIAVSYAYGEVFQHFGHSEQFKIYEVENDKIVSNMIINANGNGHSALAEILDDNDIDVLICGGIGAGAQNALESRGIELCSGASGDADDTVEAYLNGTLKSSGVNCNRHGEECSCNHDESSCEGGCGGCHRVPLFDGKNVGKKCRVHYIGAFNDGKVFDSSYNRDEPLEFVCGAGMMILGFDKAVANMEVGQTVDVHLLPEEAYGEIDPEAIITINIEELPGSEELSVGQQVYLQNVYGQPFPVKVNDKTDKTITFDANHEMAGKELNFKIELIEIL